MISIFQHGKDEGPGTIPEYLGAGRLPFRDLHLYDGDTVPAELPEKLIVLGGQMSVNDTRDYPYFDAEKAIIRKMVRKGRPVLGICLGAQMIASAFGQEVRKGAREIGWTTVRGCGPAWNGAFGECFSVFHWHEETFNLPAGSTLLVKGDTVQNQAFRLGSAVGVQFHPEVDAGIISAWAASLPAAVRADLGEKSGARLREAKDRCHALVSAFVKGWVP